MNLLDIFQALWGFWPLMFLAALEGTLNRSRKRKLGSNLVHDLLLVWGMFAILWVILASTGHPARGYFIPQPHNTTLFWLIGIGLFAVKGSGWLIDHLHLLRKMRQARDVDNLIELSPSEFERVVAQTYRSFGHRVEIVAAQGDHGIDLVVHSPRVRNMWCSASVGKGRLASR